jgi:hypothetical protein
MARKDGFVIENIDVLECKCWPEGCLRLFITTNGDRKIIDITEDSYKRITAFLEKDIHLSLFIHHYHKECIAKWFPDLDCKECLKGIKLVAKDRGTFDTVYTCELVSTKEKCSCRHCK